MGGYIRHSKESKISRKKNCSEKMRIMKSVTGPGDMVQGFDIKNAPGSGGKVRVEGDTSDKPSQEVIISMVGLQIVSDGNCVN